jgi:predicted P-loop ATPase
MRTRHVNNATPELSPDFKTITRFLTTQLQRDWFHLYSSDPDADRRSMRGYVAESPEDACEWIDREQSRGRNIYFAFNYPSRHLLKKAGKQEIRQLCGYHIEWDLPKDLDRSSAEATRLMDEIMDHLCDDPLLSGNPCVIMSGNGVQAFWFFAESWRATDTNQGEVETVNKQLAEYYGADNSWNSDRIMRLPGTVNYPNELKRKRGCEPVLSYMEADTSQDFEPQDFAKLPKVKPVTILETPTRQDYTRAAYSEDWLPYRWSHVMKAIPDLPVRLQETLDGGDGGDRDRSRAVYRLLHELLNFLVLDEGERSAEEMQDDLDIKKQLAELCWEGAAANTIVSDVMDHVLDHGYGRAQLGYDIGKMFQAAVAQEKKPTVKGEVRMKQAAETHRINHADEDDVTPAEAEIAFSQWFRNHVHRKDLPEVDMQADQESKRQFATLTNIRMALSKASITARWDAMRNEPRFFVDPEAGTQGARKERPAFNWERALSTVASGERSRQEIRLILGALVGIGIVDKAGAEEMLCAIAYEKPFHPIEDYATAKPWDGVDRIAQAAACLTTDHPLAARYIQVHFYQQIGAVLSLRHHRKAERGLQLDSTVVLCGAQDVGKSTFWEVLTPHGFLSPGSSLKLGTMREADSMRDCLSGLVCVLNEIGQTLDRSDANALKDFQTATLDTYRTAYARHALSKPRMTVLCGTANQDFQLKDQTGSRRYLCMVVTHIDWEGVNRLAQPEELQQIYAQAWEAVMEDGQRWRLTEDERAIRDRENDVHRELPEEESRVADYMSSVGKGHTDAWLSMTQICRVLDIRYISGRAHILRRALDEAGVEYRKKVKHLQKVYYFPVLPERLDELKLSGK